MVLRMMRASASALVVGAARSLFGGSGRGQVVLKPGDVAPEFALVGSDGRTHRLSALRGHTVVIAWFPKAFTGG